MDDIAIITLIGITFLAAIINGGLGYGFSSTAVPVALLFYANRVLNPAIVLIEVVINLYILLIHFKIIQSVFKRVVPILIGAAPGVLFGVMLLSSIDSEWIKLITFSVLLPLVLLQAGGVRRPVEAEKTAGIFVGGGIGFFYAVTTVSGPPLALILSNQGLQKKEFRAALSVIRLFLSSLTAMAYYQFQFYQVESVGVLQTMIPSVLVGIPIGTYVIRKVDAETFRRVCMSFDAWFIAFGLSRVLIQLNILKDPAAYSILVLAVLIDSGLLYKYFTIRKKQLQYGFAGPEGHGAPTKPTRSQEAVPP